MALAVVLSLVTLLILIALSVATTGIATLNLTGANQRSEQSLYAAEAGLAAAFREIIAGTAGWTGYSEVAYGECTYSVEATPGPQPATSARPAVPAGMVYLLATGKSRGAYPRRVAVLVAGGPAAQPASAFPYAVAAVGRIEMQGAGMVGGSVKATGDIRMQGATRILPVGGDGRVLSSSSIEFQGAVRRDPSQDMRARNEIRLQNRTVTADPVQQLFPNDSTAASAPFIADGRFTNTLSSGEIGDVLPNPDPQALLGLTSDGAGGYLLDGSGNYVIDPTRGANVVVHTETSYGGNTNFDLGGKIHWFQNGVRFSGNTDFIGTGTIVATGGNGVEFGGNVGGSGGPAQLSVLALRLSGQTNSNNPRIDFQGNSNLQGLVLAHDRVETQGNFHLDGLSVSYSGDFRGQGNRHITFNSAALRLPGLETWLVPPGGASGPGTLGIPPGQPLKIVWWQRL